MVLSRKIGDTITIGDQIKIHIQEIRGNSVKIAIEAPDDMVIHRQDIYPMVENQNRMAAKATLPQLNSLAEKMLEKIMAKMKEQN